MTITTVSASTSPGRHLVVGLEIPRAAEAVGDRAVDGDHPDDEQNLQIVEVGQPGRPVYHVN
jgi:hypothetical protein